MVMITQLIVKGMIIIMKHLKNHENQWIDELSPIIFIDSFSDVSISIVMFLMTFFTDISMHRTKRTGKVSAANCRNISSTTLGYGYACSFKSGSVADALSTFINALSISFCSSRKHPE